MQERSKALEQIVTLRLAGKRQLTGDELASCAGESATIAMHVAAFRGRLGFADSPFEFLASAMKAHED